MSLTYMGARPHDDEEFDSLKELLWSWCPEFLTVEDWAKESLGEHYIIKDGYFFVDIKEITEADLREAAGKDWPNL